MGDRTLIRHPLSLHRPVLGPPQRQRSEQPGITDVDLWQLQQQSSLDHQRLKKFDLPTRMNALQRYISRRPFLLPVVLLDTSAPDYFLCFPNTFMDITDQDIADRLYWTLV
jgi:hypothetical protein